MGWEYLPTCPFQCGHFSRNLGKKKTYMENLGLTYAPTPSITSRFPKRHRPWRPWCSHTADVPTRSKNPALREDALARKVVGRWPMSTLCHHKMYLEPQWPLFLKGPNPSKQGRNSKQNKGPHLGSRYLSNLWAPFCSYQDPGVIESWHLLCYLKDHPRTCKSFIAILRFRPLRHVVGLLPFMAYINRLWMDDPYKP